MHRKSHIYWLASFPKSGNTWVRVFIDAIRQRTSGKVQADGLPYALDLNQLGASSIASDRQWIENILGFDISDLNQDEIDLLRPKAYEWYSHHINDIAFVKVHDAYRFLPGGTALFPASCSRGLLYIIRNPLDVCVSLADHLGCSIDQGIAHMSSLDFSLAANHSQMDDQLRQIISSWSEHARSWLDVPELNRIPVRYEDLHRDPLNTFTRIAEFLELGSNQQLIVDTLERIQFKNLQALESAAGFREAATDGRLFFRRGIVGDWQTQLNSQQVSRLIADHTEMMQQLGYLDNNRQLTDLVYP